MLSTTVVVGTQWGDEGKGKITDYLAQKSQIVVRYQGGNNAGHTIIFDNKKYKLHMVPSGIFYPDKICILGNGMVINLPQLILEIEHLQECGISTDNLKISDRAHIIMPYHLLLDQAEEKDKGINKIGTTGKGIGPAYMDKVARSGLRICDLLDEENLREKLEKILNEKNKVLNKIYAIEEIEFNTLFEDLLGWAKYLSKYIVDTSVLLNNAIDARKKVLFEGAQGVMLDIDHGTYPYVTSSSPSAGGVCIGAGVGPTKIQEVLGVSKAYTTRVGDGPFPTELIDSVGDRIRDIGKEYGTTTGRARRIGWFDSVVVRHAVRVSGITGISLNCLDVLTGIDTLKICTSYQYKEKLMESYPASLETLSQCTPVYEELDGWSEDITQVNSLSDLPTNAQNYLHRISQLLNVPIKIFSVGPDRTQTIEVNSNF